MFINVTLPLLISSLLPFNPYGKRNDDQPFPLMDLPGDIKGRIIAEAISNDPQTVLSLSQVSRDIRNLTNAKVEKNVHLKALRKAFIDLTEKPDDWIKSAKQAGLNNQEPNHLLEILDIEKVFFAEFLKQKESTIENDPVEWKKHTLASLLSYYAARDVADHTAKKVATISAFNVADDSAWDATKNAAWHAAFNVADASAWHVAFNAILDAARNGADYASWYHSWDAADLNAILDAAANASKDLSCPNEIGRVAYRVAETQAWITVLDPSLKIFEKSYDVAYQRLDRENEIDMNGWFESQETFKAKMHQYFGEGNENLDEHSKKFLYPLVKQLNQIANEKIFSQSVSATGS